MLSGRRQLDLAIYDMSGKEIIKEKLKITGTYTKRLDLSQFGQGTYLIHIVGGPEALFNAQLIIY
jgi:hypothetical protein